MTKDEQANFEAFQVMRGHVHRLADLVEGQVPLAEGADIYKEIADQVGRVQKATAAYLALPKAKLEKAA